MRLTLEFSVQKMPSRDRPAALCGLAQISYCKFAIANRVRHASSKVNYLSSVTDIHSLQLVRRYPLVEKNAKKKKIQGKKLPKILQNDLQW